ncbi:FAD-dependent monooxygenase [Streptomyces sp. NPDC005892]|uniref:FAD-dependent monooxygenase n=1 Tax=Streptomyces sp. NPDC005892 TaxID=3155593 RepID=UPI0033F0CEAC
MPSTDTDVLIAGAGPAGLALAIDLRRRGVAHRVISAADGGFEGSRAKGVQPRTLEVLDDLGALETVQAHSRLYPKLGLHLGPLTVSKTMIKRHPASEDVPHPNSLMVAQYDTDAALRGRLAELGGTVKFGIRLSTYTADARGATATVERADGGSEQIRARFLVGADGGGSTVRRTSGIDFPGTTDESDRMIVADLSLDGLSADRWHVWPRHAGRFMALCPLPDGTFQLMLKLRPEEKADLDREAIARMIGDFVGRANITVREIHWSSVWRPNIRLAASYRSGPVLLVGDAAHVHPPTGGQGMNTGIQDAYNLGWKLAQVLAGAPDALLDTYQAERRPVAARVLGLSSEIYDSMNSRPLAGTKRGDEERQLTLSYAGGPLAPDAAGSPGPRPGDRAPDAAYTDTEGRTGRLHQAFRGTHFTLLALGTQARPAADGLARPAGGAEIRILAVADPAGALRQHYAPAGPALVLVRPDGYIAATASAADTSAIENFLALAAPARTA